MIHQNGHRSIVWYTNMAAVMSCEKGLRQASSNYRRCGNTLNFKMTNLDLKYLLFARVVGNVSRLPTPVEEVKYCTYIPICNPSFCWDQSQHSLIPCLVCGSSSRIYFFCWTIKLQQEFINKYQILKQLLPITSGLVHSVWINVGFWETAHLPLP